MSKDIRIYILIVVLPAILLVAGGIRLIPLELGRMRAAAMQTLQKRANMVANDIEKELEATQNERSKAHTHLPHEAKMPPAKRGWGFMRRRAAECKHHELPPEVRFAAEKAIAKCLEATDGDIIAEIRHSCGCIVVAGRKPVKSSMNAFARLPKPWTEYNVVTARSGGDAEIATSLFTQIAAIAILLLLFTGTLAAGIILLVRYAKAARDDARRKTDFLSNVSHELKTPLTSIRMFAEMIASNSLDAEALAKAGATLARETARLNGQIESLLEFTRLERGTRKCVIEDFKLCELLDETRESWKSAIAQGLEVSCAEDLIMRSDREAVRRILDCLLENAAKYSSKSGPVSISAESSNGRISVKISDCGPGMSAQEAKHCFERFWRADNSVTRTTGGTGLGLAIARELAYAMGASLELTHHTGTCTFTLETEAANG